MTRARVRHALVVLTALALALVSDAQLWNHMNGWPRFAGGQQLQVSSLLPGPLTTPTLAWQQPIGAASSSYSNLTVVSGVLSADWTTLGLVTRNPPMVLALAVRANGSAIYNVSFPEYDDFVSTPSLALATSLLLVKSLVGSPYTEVIRAVNLTSGELLWRRTLNATVIAGDVLPIGELAYTLRVSGVGAADVLCLNSTTGALLWSFALAAKGHFLSSIGFSPVVPALIVHTQAGVVLAVNVSGSTPTLLWTTQVSAALSGHPSCAGSSVLVVDATSVFSLAVLTGAVEWNKTLGQGEVAPLVTADPVTQFVLAAAGTELYAMSALTGATMWSANFAGDVYYITLTGNGVALILTAANTMIAAQTDSGAFLWEVAVPFGAAQAVIVASGQLLVVGETGVSAFTVALPPRHVRARQLPFGLSWWTLLVIGVWTLACLVGVVSICLCRAASRRERREFEERRRIIVDSAKPYGAMEAAE